MSQEGPRTPPAEWSRLAKFKQKFRQFVTEREWQQFHSLSHEKCQADLARGTALKYGKLK